MGGCCRAFIVLIGLLVCPQLNALTLGDVNRLFKQSKVLLEEGRQVAAKEAVTRVCELFSCADTEVMGIKDHIYHYSMSKCVLGAKECMSRIVANENIGSKNNETVMATAAAAWLLGGEGVGDAATFATAAAMKNRADVASVNQQLVAQIDIYVTEFSMAYNNLSEKAKKAELQGVKDVMDHPLPNPLHTVKFNSVPTAIPIDGILEVAKKTDGNLKRQCLIIGVLYMDGLCNLPKDQDEAMKWIRASGYQDRMNEVYGALADLYLDEKETVVKRDPRKAMQWRMKAAENGDAVDQYNIGVKFGHGTGGVKKDTDEAMKWYLKAAAQGYAAAENNIGWMYYVGNGVKKDYAEAVKWFKKAVAKNSRLAQESLGRCYYKGCGVERDYAEACRLFRLGAEQKDFCSMYGLAKCLYFGKGCEKNVPEALDWLIKAAEGGDRDAQYQFGELLERGESVRKDVQAAEKWYKAAAASEHKFAKLKGLGVEIPVKTGEDTWPWTDESPDDGAITCAAP